jgi:hypothetical protein
MTETREFKDIRKGTTAEALPVDEFMNELEKIQAEICTERNRVWEHVADGTLSLPYLRRLCKEYYYLGVWYTSEFGSLVANAPDFDALDMESARMLGIPDEELVSFVPMPETIGLVLGSLYYMRRSYEEGLAAFGWAGERFAASTGYAKLMYEGMRDHYGLEVENFRVHAYAEEDHGDAADYLLRKVVTSAHVQHRVRTAVVQCFTLRNARTRALNRWLDEPGALR